MEVFVESEIAGVSLGASLYQTKVDDLIVWTGSTSENIAEVDITGFEFNAIYRIGQSQHEINATYTDAEDKSTGEQLIRRAKEKFNYKFNTSINKVDLYAEYQFHGKRYDNDYNENWEAISVKLSSFNLVNLSASYQINNQLKLQARIDNLLDKQYEIAKHYNTQGRALYLGIIYSQF
jgi:vitamin B12 transporter